MSTSNHDHATDLLPWFLNGTLDADERRRVEEHLARCEACRRELEATRSSFELYSTHLPPQALTAYVDDPGAERYRMPDGPAVERSVVDAHLAHCPSCREELELVRECRRALAEDDEEGDVRGDDARRGGVVPFRTATPAGPPPAVIAPSRGWAVALAASLVFACVAAGGWFLSSQQHQGTQQRLAELEQRLLRDAVPVPAPGAESPAPDGAAPSTGPAASTAAELAAARRRSDELAGTVDALEQQVADMERQVDRLAASATAPRSGVRYVIPRPLSGGDVLRGDGGQDGGPAPQAPADGWIYLAPELPARHLEVGKRFGYELRGPQGESLVAGTLEVVEDPAIGPFVSLVLSTAGLPDGPLTLVIGDPQDGEIARYGFVVAD